jgi:hypothetical protein
MAEDLPSEERLFPDSLTALDQLALCSGFEAVKAVLCAWFLVHPSQSCYEEWMLC